MIIDQELIRCDYDIEELILQVLTQDPTTTGKTLAREEFNIKKIALYHPNINELLNNNEKVSIQEFLLGLEDFARYGYNFVPSEFHFPAHNKVAVLDTEMVRVSTGKLKVARITVIYKNKVVMDQYCRPNYPVVDYLTQYSGITKAKLRSAQKYNTLRNQLIRFLKSHTPILLGHGLDNDLRALKIEYPWIIDTACLFGGRKSKLSILSELLLGKNIEVGQHSSLEDCCAIEEIFSAVLSASNGIFDTMAARNVERYFKIGQNLEYELAEHKIDILQASEATESARGLVICNSVSEYEQCQEAFSTSDTLFINATGPLELIYE